MKNIQIIKKIIIFAEIIRIISLCQKYYECLECAFTFILVNTSQYMFM